MAGMVLDGAVRDLKELRALGLPAGARLGSDGTITLAAPLDGVVTEIGVTAPWPLSAASVCAMTSALC